jgi:LDH2 family malate/lactate/ureidoglycolate dehydrogenase
MDLAIGKARETGACCVSMVKCGHVGRLGAYSEQAAAAGMIGFVSSGVGGPSVHDAAPYGAASPALSTNPISFSAPTEAEDPFMADFATTAIANSKVRLYRMLGRKLPPGAAVDKEGAPTEDPAAAIDGGHLLTFGRHKGFALSLFAALLGGLTGEADPEKRTMRGQFLMALDPGAFGDADAYRAGVQAFLDGMRSTPPAAGFDEVLVAGDLEARTRKRQEAEGIELPEGVWVRLTECSERFGIALPGVRAL